MRTIEHFEPPSINSVNYMRAEALRRIRETALKISIRREPNACYDAADYVFGFLAGLYCSKLMSREEFNCACGCINRLIERRVKQLSAEAAR